MIQIVDISHSILYDRYKASQDFHKMTNAAVSHEMRNPLNSISALNMVKKKLYVKLWNLLEAPQIKIEEIIAVMTELNNMMRV